MSSDARTSTEDLLRCCARGLTELGFAEQASDRAYANIETWLSDPRYVDYRPLIEDLVLRECWDELFDSFWRVIPFGTGGRRGPVGVGCNRFNAATLRSSVQGHVEHMRQQRADKSDGSPSSVVIAYDVRCYHDFRGIHGAALAKHPMRGLSSRDFARMAAEVYAGNGIRVHMICDDDDRYMSTPELSYVIRKLGADGGLNISASHNPPDDNGGKFYNRHGAQEVPPNDARMAALVDAVEEVHSLDFATARQQGLVDPLPPALHEGYLELLRAELPAPPPDLDVVFTPLHGTAGQSAGELLARAGFRVELEPSQSQPDGAFPAVPFRAPNPEVPQSMAAAVATAKKTGAPLVMACDPDGDRIGAYVRTAEGQYRFMTGNELCVLACDFRLEQLASAATSTSSKPVVIQTLVTSRLVGRVAQSRGARVIDDLLVGFKYHSNIIGRFEAGLDYAGQTAHVDDVVLAVEESHGILVTPKLRDKDGAGAALLLAQACDFEVRQGRTLLDRLDGIHRRHGYVANSPRSLIMSGARGLTQMSDIQASLRQDPPTAIAGQTVTHFEDCANPNGPRGPILSDTDASSRNVLVFDLADESRIVVRPSGTEPKIKLYVEVPSRPVTEACDLDELRRETDERAQTLADAMSSIMLSRISIELPAWTFRMSALASLDLRQRFIREALPKLLRAADLDADEQGQFTQIMARLGGDARALVAPGMLHAIELHKQGQHDSQALGFAATADNLELLRTFFAEA